LSLPFLAKLPDFFFGQTKQGVFGKCSVSLESWSRTVNNYPTDSLPPLLQAFTAASAAPHPSGQPDESLPSEVAPLPFHELAWQRADRLEAFRQEYTRHLCGTLDIPGPRPMACNPQSMRKLGLSPS